MAAQEGVALLQPGRFLLVSFFSEGFFAGGSEQPARAVRWNILTALTVPRALLAIWAVIDLSQIIAIIISCAIYPAEVQKTCQDKQSIAAWLIAYAILLFGRFMSRLLVQTLQTPHGCLHTFYRWWIYVFALWTVVGFFAIWPASTGASCIRTIPHVPPLPFVVTLIWNVQLYALARGLLILALVSWLLPLALPFALRMAVSIMAEDGGAGGGLLRRPGAPNDVIQSIPIVPFNPGEAEGTSCAICLDSYQPSEPVRQLACHSTHRFHPPCIDQWLRLKGDCPICRVPVVSAALP